MDSNKPVFNNAEQTNLVQKNYHLFEGLQKAKTIQEWNREREIVKAKFIGTSMERAMLFGYIDGVLSNSVLFSNKGR